MISFSNLNLVDNQQSNFVAKPNETKLKQDTVIYSCHLSSR